MKNWKIIVAYLFGFLLCGLIHVLIHYLLRRPFESWDKTLDRIFWICLLYPILLGIIGEHIFKLLNNFFPDKQFNPRKE